LYEREKTERARLALGVIKYCVYEFFPLCNNPITAAAKEMDLSIICCKSVSVVIEKDGRRVVNTEVAAEIRRLESAKICEHVKLNKSIFKLIFKYERLTARKKGLNVDSRLRILETIMGRIEDYILQDTLLNNIDNVSEFYFEQAQRGAAKIKDLKLTNENLEKLRKFSLSYSERKDEVLTLFQAYVDRYAPKFTLEELMQYGLIQDGITPEELMLEEITPEDKNNSKQN
jgi:hypothetical protein